jgi:small conductance mechanosensitive channel
MEKKTIIDQITEMTLNYAPQVLIALLSLIVGFWLIGWITKRISKTMEKSNVDATIRPFLISLVNVGLKVLLLLSVASMFGVQTTSFLAVLGAMAFAIGLALQGSLGNFASGVMILLFKPYKVGDLVEIQGYTGNVSEIQIFNTLLLTPDNKTVILPNSVVTSGAITNISGQGIIRVDMTFGIGYNDDIKLARSVIEKVAGSCPLVLKEKETDIFVSELADSSVNFAVRPWCKSEYFWDVYFYMHENIKIQLDNNNVSIPYPQMDVHMQKTEN